MESKKPYDTPSPTATPTSTSPSGPANRPPPPPTVVVRSSTVPLVLMVMLCLAMGVGLLISLGFNIYSAAAYSAYFQSDPDMTESHHSGNEMASNKIAIISVSGIMMESDGFTKQQIDKARDDRRVKAIVLRVDSPGGAVTAADYLFHHLKKLRDEEKKPIVVSMGSMAASGGYYVAMAASHEDRVIFCEPTGITGSIGVIIPRYDIHELLEKYDIKSDSIVSHQNKEMGSWMKEMTPEERRRMQEQVDLLFNRFKDVVREGRPALAKDDDALTQVATGEVFTGLQAKDLMLVDDVGFIEDAIERAAELGNLSQGNYRVVQYDRPPSLADALTGSIQAPQHPLDAKQLLEMTTPRAYYMYSGLPGLVP